MLPLTERPAPVLADTLILAPPEIVLMVVVKPPLPDIFNVSAAPITIEVPLTADAVYA